jgi:ribonuclease J
MNQISKNRGAALRAHKRNQDDAERIVSQYATQAAKITNKVSQEQDILKLTFLGGLDGVGENNMAVIEYQNQAIILDSGCSLGVDLPGINYAISDTTYLESIRHKIKAYVITHGHLDHIGGLRHIVPQFPAPIYGSRYTIGVIQKTFEDEVAGGFAPKLVTVNIDNHEHIQLGKFAVEFIRVTHAIPDPAAVCIDTPVGRIVATGDFRLDPEPLDHQASDKARLRQLGDQGVLLLLSDSSYSHAEGRTPTEHTLQPSFTNIIADATGRIFVAVFSSNINRTQMIINAAVAAGRKVAFDGRSMLAYAEIAVRQGILKIPKGTIVPMQQAANIPADQLLILCTGGQGEPNAALQRMSQGEHKHVNLNKGDTVIISSSPIPGNELSYDQISNRLSKKGVRLFRHPTHELDGCGPLHVSGHAKRDELREMIQMIRPKFFIPVHAGTLRRTYHAELGMQEGIPRKNIALPDNGDSFYLTAHTMESAGTVPHGSVLVDQTGGVVNSIVVKDRLMLSEEGMVAVILTIDKKSGRLLTSPDVISRGFIAMKDSQELMDQFRAELRRAVQQRFGRVDLDRFKAEMRDHITLFLFEHTDRTPIVIPVVNVIGGKAGAQTTHATRQPATQEHERFQVMRARLLGQDQRD